MMLLFSFLVMVGMWIYPMWNVDFIMGETYGLVWMIASAMTFVLGILNRKTIFGVFALILSTILLTLMGVGFLFSEIVEEIANGL